MKKVNKKKKGNLNENIIGLGLLFILLASVLVVVTIANYNNTNQITHIYLPLCKSIGYSNYTVRASNAYCNNDTTAIQVLVSCNDYSNISTCNIMKVINK